MADTEHSLVRATSSQGKSAPIFKIPTELLRHIIALLDVPSLLSLTLTNHTFHDIISSPHTWRLLFLSWFPDCCGQFTPLTTPPTALTAKLHPNDILTNHWRMETILRTRHLKNLFKSRQELVRAGYERVSSNFVPSVIGRNLAKSRSQQPTSTILELYHSIATPITHLHVNWTDEPLAPNKVKWEDPPELHPIPQVRITNITRGDGAVWYPGNGRYKAADEALVEGQEQPGTMVFTRYENRQRSLGTSMHYVDIADMHINGAGGVAFTGRKDGGGSLSLFVGYRVGSGEKIEEIIEGAVQENRGIGTGVWIANLAGLGCVEGVGLENSNDEKEEAYKEVRVDAASGLFSEYCLGAAMTTSEGEVYMFGASTRPINEGNFENPASVQTELITKWKLCPRVALISLRVDEHYTPEKKAQGRPWCVVQNVLGETWCFAGDPREHVSYFEPSGLTEDQEWDEDLRAADEEIENGPYGEELAKMDRAARDEAFERIRLEIASEKTAKRQEERHLLQGLEARHEQGKWTLLEHTRVERPISGFFLDDLSREVGLILGDNDQWRGMNKNCRIEVDFFAYVILSFFVREQDHKRLRGTRYRLNTDYVRVSPPLLEDEILHSQAYQGSADEWTKVRLRIPKSGEEIFDPKNSQKITSMAIDMSPICLAPITTPNETTVGSNARLFAIGTNHSRIYIYNIRGDPERRTSDILTPLRICKVTTGSPAITSLALTSLVLIAGASNGAVQMFDPLGSSQSPIRKLVQASTLAEKKEYMINTESYGWTREEQEEYWGDETAAATISMDPNPECWRGAVIVGSHILYWDETDCIKWKLSDDLAARKKLEEAERVKAEAEAEILRKRKKAPKPKMGRSGRSEHNIDLGLVASVNDLDEAEVHKRWMAAYGDMSEEEKRILENEMGQMGLGDLTEP